MNPGNLAVRPQKTPEMRMRSAGRQRNGIPGAMVCRCAERVPFGRSITSPHPQKGRYLRMNPGNLAVRPQNRPVLRTKPPPEPLDRRCLCRCRHRNRSPEGILADGQAATGTARPKVFSPMAKPPPEPLDRRCLCRCRHRNRSPEGFLADGQAATGTARPKVFSPMATPPPEALDRRCPCRCPRRKRLSRSRSSTRGVSPRGGRGRSRW